jgi:acyl carrier protein
MLTLPDSVVAAAAITWDAASRMLPGLGTPRFEEIMTATRAAGPESGIELREQLQAQSPEVARQQVLVMLSELVGELLRLPATRVHSRTRLTEIGMDSLMGVELRLAVEERFGLNMPLVGISDEMTLGGMADMIMKMLGIGQSEQPNLAEEMASRLEGHGPDQPEGYFRNAAD